MPAIVIFDDGYRQTPLCPAYLQPGGIFLQNDTVANLPVTLKASDGVRVDAIRR